MLEFLSRAGALILEDADVFETAVALQILNTLCHQAQELFQFGVAGIPQMAVVMGVFEQKLVRADRGLPSVPGRVAITWSCAASLQKEHGPGRGAGSGTSSPVITQDRVIGS